MTLVSVGLLIEKEYELDKKLKEQWDNKIPRRSSAVNFNDVVRICEKSEVWKSKPTNERKPK